ncbi:LuxR C-terminal-related transcriptional regulator [Streptomyces sp. NPDC060027]|uniref:LuxR C-terminal-related transcriptional regulator n=1 Tax=Streptomyces sp. NPDC060027 TaxID=3347040 RepID=UPI00369C00A0
MNHKPWPLVAREAELRDFVADLADPATKVFLVFGDEGVGKTRLAQEFLEVAGRSGHPVLRAAASAAAAAIPLGALAHLLPPDVDPGNPVAVFRGVAASLQAASGSTRSRRCVVILVDDLHLLDNTSAMLLHQLLTSNVIRLIGTVRTAASSAHAVEALDLGSATRHVNLPEFSPEQVRAVLFHALGGPVEYTAAQELIRVSGGNALFLRELVSSALVSGILVMKNQMWQLDGPLTHTVRLAQMIRQRLGRFQGDDRILETLALCEPLSMDVLESLAGADAIDGLEHHEIIRVTTEGRRTYCVLAHPLYSETIIERMSHVRKRVIYREQIARISSFRHRRREDSLRIAMWQLAAGDTVEKATLLQAVRLARHAHDYSMVAYMLEGVPEGDLDWEICLMLGEASYHMNRPAEAEKWLCHAQEVAQTDEQLIYATQQRSANLYWFFGGIEATLEVTGEAVERVSSASGRRILIANEAIYRLFTHGCDAALRCLSEVDEIEDIRMRSWGLLQKSLALSWGGNSKVAIEILDDLHGFYFANEPVANRISTVYQRCAADLFRTIILGDCGRLEEAISIARGNFDKATEIRAIELQVWTACYLGRCHLVTGSLREAEFWFTQGSALAREHRHSRPLVFAQAGLAVVAGQYGKSAEARLALQKTNIQDVDTQPIACRHLVILAEAWVTAADGDLRRAVRQLVEGADCAANAGYHLNEAWLLIEAARLNGAASVDRRLAELADGSGNPLVHAWATMAGAMAVAEGERLHAAARECEEQGLYLLAAEGASQAALAYSRMKQWKEASAATGLVDRMTGICGSAKTPGLHVASSFPLTAREREVAGLAARGLTNQEIAERLVLSVRTVDNHLQHTYSKLQINSRRDLTGIIFPSDES